MKICFHLSCVILKINLWAEPLLQPPVPKRCQMSEVPPKKNVLVATNIECQGAGPWQQKISVMKDFILEGIISEYRE